MEGGENRTDPATGEAPAAASATTVQEAEASTSTGVTSSNSAPAVTQPSNDDDSDDDDDDDSEIMEESPCGRWLKRREEVKYRDVPGVDTAYLAMDTEEGVEVVWNEAQFSETKKFKAQEDKLKTLFEALTLIEHPNIVKFHKYWTDPGKVINEKTQERSKPRLIFITEFVSSGSLKQFLRRSKKNNKKIQLQAWKRWCIQILSALSYLHNQVSSDPEEKGKEEATPEGSSDQKDESKSQAVTKATPIVHGNLTCDTIFIQHNGLVKIGSVAPDIIHHNVKTCKDNIRNLHFLAPEWGDTEKTTTAVDIYAFGMCALETAALEIQGNIPPSANGSAPTGEVPPTTGGVITEEAIQRTINSLEDPMQQDFIRKCLNRDPARRPSARDLLFHPVLFEVHSLKLLAAHELVNQPANMNETLADEAMQKLFGKDSVMAIIEKENGERKEFKLSDFPDLKEMKLEKFIEDVKYGIYPLTAFSLAQPGDFGARAATPEVSGEAEGKAETPAYDPEKRTIFTVVTHVEPIPEGWSFFLSIRLSDGMNRQLTTLMVEEDTGESMAKSLVHYGFINEDDIPIVEPILDMTIYNRSRDRVYNTGLIDVSGHLNSMPPSPYIPVNPTKAQLKHAADIVNMPLSEVESIAASATIGPPKQGASSQASGAIPPASVAPVPPLAVSPQPTQDQQQQPPQQQS